MGNYTTATKVQTLCKRVPTFSATSPITLDEVNALIDRHEAEVDVALSFHGYPTPVTTPAPLVVWLEKIVTEGVAAAVLKSLFQDPTGPNSEASWSTWERRYQEALAQLRKGNMVPASTDETGGSGVASWTTDYAGADAGLDPAAEPVFTSGMEW